MAAVNFSLSTAVSAKAIVHPRKRYIEITDVTFFIILHRAGCGLGVALPNELK